MSWSKLDDRLHENPKIGAMSDKAFRLYILSITYSSGRRSRGRLSRLESDVVCRLAGASEDVVNELIYLRAWDESAEGYCIHDYIPGGGYGNPFNALRQQASKFRNMVFNRDGNRCVDCDSESDLTIDHIIPLVKGGDNTPDNLQTLCRSCNGRKGGR